MFGEIRKQVRGGVLMEPIKLNIGDILLHKKGKYYKVLMHAKNSETEETMIVYMKLETGGVWVRPLTMFTSDRFTVAIPADQLD